MSLWRFPGGLRLPGHKQVTCAQIQPAPIPEQLILPVLQHIGDYTIPAIEIGERVLKGQIVAYCGSDNCKAPSSAPIHASTSGTVVAIEEREVPHPSGLRMLCVIIDCDGKDEWIEHQSLEECTDLDPEDLRMHIARAGIVGLGGAGFPAHLKIQRGLIHTLILNGAECEPYISCDDFLMRERAEDIITGAKIIAHALGGLEQIIIGVEDNKPEAISALRDAAKEMAGVSVSVRSVPTRYPTGGERQLIKVLTGKEIGHGSLPSKYGMVMHNVGTAAAVYQAVKHGKPLVSRVVTVTGDGVENPCNIEVLLGTPMHQLLAQCGYKQDKVERLIMGGPMMGFALPHDDLPIIKTTNCLIAQTGEMLHRAAPPMPCIRCGACEQACPIGLLPQQLYWHARAKDFNKIQQFNLFDCIECGCCSYVCPSQIPLVQYYRYAKSEVRAAEREKQQADLARERHEFRAFRLEREKQERQARHKQKRTVLKKPAAGNADEDAKKAAIQAALERVKAKKAAAEGNSAPQSNATESSEADKKAERQAQIKAARERAAAKKAAAEAEAAPAKTPLED